MSDSHAVPMIPTSIGTWLGLVLPMIQRAFGLGRVRDLFARPPAADLASDRIEVWHGLRQKVGHLGEAQPDFNLMGRVEKPSDLISLQYAVNDGTPVELNFRCYRRLAADGHFNADIPIATLRHGPNTIEIEARFADGSTGRQVVEVTRSTGNGTLPLSIDWKTVADPQDVGQYVDGHWQLGDQGLRVAHMGYDRIFLIGNQSWQNYQVNAAVTVHEVARETAPLSGGNGLGLLLGFAGHVVGGHLRYPVAQPKWGYFPFGAIAWLRWRQGRAGGSAIKQFHPGDSHDTIDHGRVAIRTGERYVLKVLCQTLPDSPEAEGVARYAFKIWPAGKDEPSSWDWEHRQVSRYALRRGGIGLVAHHVDASFADISVVPLEDADLPSR